MFESFPVHWGIDLIFQDFASSWGLYHMNIRVESILEKSKLISNVLYINGKFTLLFLDKYVGYFFLTENRISHGLPV